MVQELCFSYIGVAAAVGQPLNIPVIVRSLGQDMYRVGMSPHGRFRPGLELMTYLDGNLSSDGLDDPALGFTAFRLPWWNAATAPTAKDSYLCSATIKWALDHHRSQLATALVPMGAPHSIASLTNELNKPAYTWHESANDDQPNTPTDCTRCRLYRAVALGVVDQLRDTHNMVHACEIANEAEKDIAIRRASGFNELFEAALKKECDGSNAESGAQSAQAVGQEYKSAQGSGKGKEKQQSGPAVEQLKQLMKTLVVQAAASKWTWGVDLTDDDLRGLIRGADRQHQVAHSGYDSELPSISLRSESEVLDPANLGDPNDPDLRFDDLSQPFVIIPELLPHQMPRYSGILVDQSGEECVDAEPDPVIEAFTKRAKAQAKLLMQDEVDQPVSFFDYGSEFATQIAWFRRRPWLAPDRPIVPPPTNIIPVAPDQDMHSDSEVNETILLPDSDGHLDHISIADSDEHSNRAKTQTSNSSPPSQFQFPVSDDDSSDAMDVVRSDERTDEPMSVVTSESAADSLPDHIVLPSESPLATSRSIGQSGMMAGFKRDPKTSRFTPASFANIPDDFID
jgi:hypothetical protein